MADGIRLKVMAPADLDALLAVAPGLFDNPVDPEQAAAFLADPLHELVLAYDGEIVVGMATGTVLFHPDKPPSMFVNEVGTRPGWERRGVATATSRKLFEVARARGCKGIWLGTEPDNEPALGLYRSLGGDEVPVICFGWDAAFDDMRPADLPAPAKTGGG